MAELTAGAVSSLLGLIRNAELMMSGRAKEDMQFIKDEMDSINGTLMYLTENKASHNDQVRVWMRQVRDIAYVADDCITLYRRDLTPPEPGFWPWLRHVPTWLSTVPTRHRLAKKIHELKDRVRDVGERRQRYGVVGEIPTKNAASSSGHGSQTAPSSDAAAATAAADARADEEDDDQNHAATATVVDGRPDRRRALEPRTLEDYCCENLHKWLKEFNTKRGSMVPFIAVEAPRPEDAAAVSSIVSYVAAEAAGFNPAVWVNLPLLHAEFDLPLEPWEILCYILGEPSLDPSPYKHKAAEINASRSRRREAKMTRPWAVTTTTTTFNRKPPMKNGKCLMKCGKR